MKKKYVCVHGHFYQPPRENPWLEEVELQPSAYPYHDWNERISAECYATNGASRILDANGKITAILNNYSRISFNFGPTLLSWMERHATDVYQSIITADRLSMPRFSGHGAAIAQVYNHMIMPLANSRDKNTQILWGIRDFVHRFGRDPEGMWLSETAVDLESLQLLADHGIRFTILAPNQAKMVRRCGDKEWQNVEGEKVDPRRAYKCALPKGGEISLFFYDGPISQDLAFGGLLHNGEHFAQRLMSPLESAGNDTLLSHIATDGETYGHHHRDGDMALAYCLDSLEHRTEASLTIYAEFLEKEPPQWEVQIHENSSWSCVHGVERWRSDCGCNSGMHGDWHQKWRGPLRDALDHLRDALIPAYEKEMGRFCSDPWKFRDEYISVVLDRSKDNLDAFFAEMGCEALNRKDRTDVLKLLEMQRHAMLMYTSCGWFFDEISGIETIQVIQYAARCIQLAKEVCHQDFESQFLQDLAEAPSNLPTIKDGGEAYRRHVTPSVVNLSRVGAHYAVSGLFQNYPERSTIYSFEVERTNYELLHSGRERLALGTTSLTSLVTLENSAITFAVLHLGDHNIYGGVRAYLGATEFEQLTKELGEAFNKSDIPEVIRLMNRHFGKENYSLWHLFGEERHRILDSIMTSMNEELEVNFSQIYNKYYSIMRVRNQLGLPQMKPFATVGEFVLNRMMKEAFEKEPPDVEQLGKLWKELQIWKFELDRATLAFIASKRVNALMEAFCSDLADLPLLETIERFVALLVQMPLELKIRKAQNLHFSTSRSLLAGQLKAGDADGILSKRWLELFSRLGDHLEVRTT